MVCVDTEKGMTPTKFTPFSMKIQFQDDHAFPRQWYNGSSARREPRRGRTLPTGTRNATRFPLIVRPEYLHRIE